MKLDAIREEIDRLHLDEVTSTILFYLTVQGRRATAEELYEVITGYGKLIEVEKNRLQKKCNGNYEVDKWMDTWLNGAA